MKMNILLMVMCRIELSFASLPIILSMTFCFPFGSSLFLFSLVKCWVNIPTWTGPGNPFGPLFCGPGFRFRYILLKRCVLNGTINEPLFAAGDCSLGGSVLHCPKSQSLWCGKLSHSFFRFKCNASFVTSLSLSFFFLLSCI